PKVVFARQPERLRQFFYEKIPGLKRAEELGLVTELGISRRVPGTEMDLRLERIWYNRENVYLLYSLGAPLSVVVPDRDIEVEGNLLLSGDMPNNGSFYPNIEPGEGVLYEGRFYSCMVFNPVCGLDNKPLE
ncbi:MAG: hypothetical protein K6U74_20480, partial [Firmicutes bacterium]|nr:hypothetical protein [Bacillota bacterium]